MSKQVAYFFFRLMVFGVLLVSLNGCLAYRAVTYDPTKTYERMKLSALTSSTAREETLQQLRLYDLEGVFDNNPKKAISELVRRLNTRFEPGLVVAIAELSFLRAKTLSQKEPKLAATYCLLAIDAARRYSRWNMERTELTWVDQTPRFVAELYNESLTRLVELWQNSEFDWDKQIRLTSGKVDYSVSFQSQGQGVMDPAYFDRLYAAYTLKVEGLRNHYRTYGLGAPLIGTRKNKPGSDNFDPWLVQPTIVKPLTAIVYFPTPELPPTMGTGEVIIRLYDPLQTAVVTIGDVSVPLEADFSTSFAIFLERRETSSLWVLSAFWRALTSDEFVDDIGLVMLEPYDPNKIPVIMVHGLFSGPETFIEMLNDLRGDEELRGKYQFLLFYYPTGLPIPYTSYRLRKSLLELEESFDPEGENPAFQNMVVVGHSMGGLLSRTLVHENGTYLWDSIFSKPPEEIKADKEQLEFLKGALIYDAQPFVKRVVFIATPHGGSEIASNFIGRLGSWLISLPSEMFSLRETLARENKDALKIKELRLSETPKTSIDQLAADDAWMKLSMSVPLESSVPLHSIIGVQDSPKGPGGTDGVVAYESSHIDGVRSEALVPAPHSCLEHPLTIIEVKRILLKHLEESSNNEVE